MADEKNKIFQEFLCKNPYVCEIKCYDHVGTIYSARAIVTYGYHKSISCMNELQIKEDDYTRIDYNNDGNFCIFTCDTYNDMKDNNDESFLNAMSKEHYDSVFKILSSVKEFLQK